MAIAAARHAGVMVEHGIAALCQFKSPKRRMELKGEVAGISVYDDFAHHPTAIETTLGGLRAKVGKARILAVLEPRSNTMKLGVHKEELAGCFDGADEVFFFQPANIGWDLGEVTAHMSRPAQVFDDLEALINRLVAESRAGDHILIMSNGGFGGIHDKLIARLSKAHHEQADHPGADRRLRRSLCPAPAPVSGAGGLQGLPARLFGRPGGAQDRAAAGVAGVAERAVCPSLSPIWRQGGSDSGLRQGGVVLAGGLRLGGAQADGGLPLLHGHRLGHRQRRPPTTCWSRRRMW